MPGQGLLLVMTDIPAEIEDEFNRWYDEEHVRDMLAFQGVLSARRYRVVEGQPTYLAMYDLKDSDVVEQAEYQYVSGWSPLANPLSISISNRYFNTIRGVYQHLLTLPSPEPSDVSGARALMLRGLGIDPEHEEEVHDWYNTEHLPNLSRVSGVLRARRYRLNTDASHLKGNPPVYMAVYELERRDALDGEEWKRAVETPWTDRVRRFFRTPSLRNVYERIVPA
ncbi:MAG: hypothetical protein A3G80_06730 [Betaproteobacteria bacterium RIFCSPLOWO2_12_FULL_62_13b]|nr:MAG: hypothetical protein A3G80_06730 [Betaproteobacteria bacterium RIFCSPLOWO2_12_FULL_62_13b]